jgi:hypothetical protein
MNNQKKYKFKFSKIITLVAILGVILAVACIALNVSKIIKNINANVDAGIYNNLSVGIAILLSAFLIVIIISAFISSYYKITEKEVILKWGFIKNVIKVDDVKEIKLLTDSKKLQLVFEDESFFVIVVNDEWKQEFVDEFKQKFPKILYIQETEPPKQDKKL